MKDILILKIQPTLQSSFRWFVQVPPHQVGKVIKATNNLIFEPLRLDSLLPCLLVVALSAHKGFNLYAKTVVVVPCD